MNSLHCYDIIKFQVKRFKLQKMNKCYNCGKGVLYGRSHTHHRGVAGGRWKKRAPKTRRIFEPNLQHVDIVENGEIKIVKLCTRCLKRIKKDVREGKKPFLELAYYQAKLATASVAKRLAQQSSAVPVSI